MCCGLSSDTALQLSRVNSKGMLACKSSKPRKGTKRRNSWQWEISFMLAMEIVKKILTFRDILDLSPYNSSRPLHELVVDTTSDLHNLYLKIAPYNMTSQMKQISINQGMIQLYYALKLVGDSWAKNHSWIITSGENTETCLENLGSQQLGLKLLAKLNHMINLAKKMYDMKCLSFSLTPMEERNAENQEVAEEVRVKRRKINCEGKKDLIESNAMPGARALALLQPFPSPQPSSTSNGREPNQPWSGTEAPPMFQRKGASAAAPPPPPPPVGVVKALFPKKENAKLKRSTHMGTLYRILKGKVEGYSLSGKLSHQRKAEVGGSGVGKEGMADALAEITKRSPYFQQIEEDVHKHEKSINEIKDGINSFKTKDMAELVKFHKYVEEHLEELTDENQVLAKFEGFPTTKLESLRTAAALYLKLQTMLTNLKNWKVAPPLGEELGKVESYFDKMKLEIDTLERSKDEDAKQLRAHNIDFDFSLILRVKESMVDISSRCMEMALKEHKEANKAANTESESKNKHQMGTSKKMLWRTFQLAFRVYSFAGGQDDRAEELSKEVAHEIESCSE